MTKDRLSVFINVLTVLFIIVTLKEIYNLAHYDRYAFLFSHLSQKMILLRQCFSLFFRSLLVIVAVGILLRNDFFRKAFLFLCFFSILTAYWKHPVAVLENVVASMQAQGELFGILKERPELMVKILLWYNYAHTVAPSLFLIYLFTRPKVRQEFSKGQKEPQALAA